MKLLIAGSRSISEDKLRDLFDINSLVRMFDLEWPKEFVHGGAARGTDRWFAEVCDSYHDTTPTKVFSAEWVKYGKRAGMIRNNKMAVYADVLILIWDGKSSGSAQMKSAMMNLGKPVHEIIIRKVYDRI